jgi:ribosomal protein L7Ae-like RNA K-turn-binding protein
MEKIYRFMGIALKAGSLISGNDICEKSIKKKDYVKLIIITEDASDNTKKKFFDKCLFRSVKLIVFGDKESVGNYIGKSERSVVGILDTGFANKLCEMIENKNNDGGDAYGENKNL